MKVKDLIEILKNVDEDFDVITWHPRFDWETNNVCVSLTKNKDVMISNFHLGEELN